MDVPLRHGHDGHLGRLIRTASDKGTVVILDPRMITKPYGRTLLAALPPATVEVEPFGQDRG